MGETRSALVEGLANQIGTTPLSSAEIDAILELAATAAHGTGDRTSAPLASFLAGIAAANADNREQAISELNRQAVELTASSAS